MAFATEDGRVSIWETETGQEVVPPTRPLGHLGEGSYCGNGRCVFFDPSVERVFAVFGDEVWSRRVFLNQQSLVNFSKDMVPRCLTPQQREDSSLDPEPPLWCITGMGNEKERDPDKWKPKWPYNTPAWRNWLLARNRGEQAPLPKDCDPLR